jgi:hypothetical protein
MKSVSIYCILANKNKIATKKNHNNEQKQKHSTKKKREESNENYAIHV